jgi:hypothetical protein
VSLYTVVNRGVVGRLGQRPSEPDATVAQAGARVAQARTRNDDVRLPGASMRVLEACIALTAIATAILIGVGR